MKGNALQGGSQSAVVYPLELGRRVTWHLGRALCMIVRLVYAARHVTPPPLVQVITTPEERYEEYRQSSDFIKEYIFPGACCPSFSALTQAMAAHSNLWSARPAPKLPPVAGSGLTVVALGIPGLEGEVLPCGYDSDAVLCPRPAVSTNSSFL